MSLTASPSPGTFASPQLVTLSDAGADTILYTLDGTSPQYIGYARDWNDGLLTNQANVSSNSGAVFTNPSTFLRVAHSASATSAVAYMTSAPVVADFRASVRFRFNSSSCNNDTSAAIVYRCAGLFSANDTYGFLASAWSRGSGIGRGSNTSAGAYTSVASSEIRTGLAFDVWHTLTVTVSGGRHQVHVNGVLVNSVDDNTYLSAGYIGLRSWSPTGTAVVDFDDFAVESLGSTTKKYTTEIPVVPAPTATTIKALSVTGTTPSSVSDFAYTIGLLRAQQPTATVANHAVTLSDPTPSASIYYTTDGSTPVVSVAETYPIGSTGTFTDSRDGKVYKTVLMPDQKWWSAENLAWAGAGSVYNNNPALEPVYGRNYTWDEAVGTACPTGTHAPTLADVTTLLAAIPDPKGTKLKANSPLWTTNTGTDDYGFAALPGGNAGYFLGEYATFWMSSSVDAFGYQLVLRATLSTASISDQSKSSKNAVRFIVDSGNVPDPAVTISGTLYTGPFPFKVGQVVCAVTRAAGYLDSLPVRLYPVDNDTGVVVGRGYISTQNTITQLSFRIPWLRSTLWLANPNGVTFSSDWLKSAGYRFYGDILQTPPPPTTGLASTKQQRFFADEGIQTSVFPRQPTVFNNRVDWGNGPVTNRSLKIFWRIPRNDSYLLASTKTDVKKASALGDLNIDSQSNTWAIGGAQAQAQLSAPALAHYIDVNASLGFVVGTAQSSPIRVTGGRNSAPTSSWLSPAAGDLRLNVPVPVTVTTSDADLDTITWTMFDGAAQIGSGTTSGGNVSSLWIPQTTGPKTLSVTLTDSLGASNTTYGPTITVVDNQFAQGEFTSPADNTQVALNAVVPVVFSVTDAEGDPIYWSLLDNGITIASGSSSVGIQLSAPVKFTPGTHVLSLVVADSLGASPPIYGPRVYSVPTTGTLHVQESPDSAVFTGTLGSLESASMLALELPDSLNFLGDVIPPVPGTIFVTEDQDTAVFQMLNLPKITGVLRLFERQDTALFRAPPVTEVLTASVDVYDFELGVKPVPADANYADLLT